MIATTRLNKRHSKHSLTFSEGTTQDSLLSGVAEAARRLLVIADFDAAVNDALEAIATAAAIDRIFIYQHYEDAQSGREFATCPYEWTQPGVIRTCEISGQYPMFYGEFGGYTQWVAELKSGQSVQKLAREMSAAGQIKQKQEQALSVLTVPIFIEGTYWGNFGFDDCTTERIWSDAEISVLETAAASFAGALQRQNHLADLETYNQQLRQRDDLLNSVNAAAQCLVANDDLAQAIPKALRILGEGIGCDRVGILKNIGQTSTQLPDYQNVLYEWTAPDTVSQISHPDSARVSCKGLEPLLKPYLQSSGFGGLVDEWPEPLRSAFKAVDILSSYSVPIWIDDQWWGVVGFDYCKEAKQFNPPEVAVLKTAAACIGSAIERDRTRQDHEAAAQVRAAELEQHNQTLAERDRILEATAAAANVMLTADDFDSAVNAALKIVGEGLGVDRVNLGKYFAATNQQTSGYHQFLYEWTSPGTTVQIKHPKLVRISDSGIDFAIDTVRRGDIFGGVVEELPEPFRSGQLELGVKSTYSAPIKVKNRYWGVVGFDDCQKLTRRSESELEALKTLANCIGNAIERDSTVKASEAAELEMIVARERAARAAELEAANQVLTRRDRWLETTAIAAHQLLSSDDVRAGVRVALQTIGENLECDRISVMQHILAPDAPAADLGLMRVLYEWDAEGIRSQCEELDLREIPSDGVEDWFKRVMAGHWVGGLIGVLKDPFRSSMQALDIQSTYAMPVFVEGKFWGIVTIDHCRDAKRLSAAELAVFKTAATCVGSAIYQATVRRDRAAQERAAELAKTNAAISETLSALTATPELNEFLGQILIKISEQIGACKAHLFFYDEETETLCQHIAVQEGQVYQGTAPGAPEMFYHPVPTNLSGAWQAIVNSSKPFTLDENNPQAADLYWPESLPWHQAEGHLASTSACMKVGQKPIGFIGFAFRHLAVLTDEQLEFIQALTNQATLSIHLTRLAEEAKQAAVLQAQEKAAQQRVAELAKTNEALSQTLNVLTTEPELDRFLGKILTQINEQIG
ncbi:MAG: GAF domain-containing protein, partial [Cyanobacteria bacterium P01_F01_bin.4]